MLSKILLVLGAAAISTTAFQIPADQPDGIYSAYYSEDGTEVHELLAPVPLSSRSDSSRSPSARSLETLSKRGQTWCGCGIGLNHGDCDDANACLANWCGASNPIQGNQAIYCHSGSAVAFACNYAGSVGYCSRAIISTADQTITNSCGWYIAGTWQVDGDSHLDLGYMNWDSNFCGAAESSPAHSC